MAFLTWKTRNLSKTNLICLVLLQFDLNMNEHRILLWFNYSNGSFTY